MVIFAIKLADQSGKTKNHAPDFSGGKMKVVLPGSIRSKKNSKRVFKKGKFTVVLPSKTYEKWENQARLSIAIQLRGHEPTEQNVHVRALIYYKGPRPDLSGCLESVGDCLEGFLWVNDKQIVSWDGSRLYHNLQDPRTEITMKIIKGEQ